MEEEYVLEPYLEEASCLLVAAGCPGRGPGGLPPLSAGRANADAHRGAGRSYAGAGCSHPGANVSDSEDAGGAGAHDEPLAGARHRRQPAADTRREQQPATYALMK